MNPRLAEHFMHPTNAGTMPDPDLELEVRNGACGDLVQLQLRVGAPGTVTRVRYRAYGCSTALAVASLVSQELVGKDARLLAAEDDDTLLALLGPLEPRERHCLALAVDLCRTVSARLANGGAPHAGAAASPQRATVPRVRAISPTPAGESAAARVLAIVAACLDVAVEALEPGQRLAEDLGIDSMVASNVIASLEEAFEIVIADRDAVDARTLADVIALVATSEPRGVS